jgi:hypothetical protein
MSEHPAATATQVQEQVAKAQEIVVALLRQVHVTVPERPALLTDLHRIQGHLSYVLQVLADEARR